MKGVNYKNGKLTIVIPSSSPAALHASIMQSIVSNMKYSVASPDKATNFAEETIPLINLLQTMLPDERQLESGLSEKDSGSGPA